MAANNAGFMFFPAMWLEGTLGFNYEQKGAYMELLILQSTKGKFTELQAQGLLKGHYSKLWPVIKNKFENDGEFFWNVRLRSVIDSRIKFRESRSNNAKSRYTKKEKESPQVVPELTAVDYRVEESNTHLLSMMLKAFVKENPEYPKSPKEDYPALLDIASFITAQLGIDLDFTIYSNDKIISHWHQMTLNISAHPNWKTKALKTLAKFNKQEIFSSNRAMDKKLKAIALDDDGWILFDNGKRMRANHHDYEAYKAGVLSLSHFDKQ